MNVRRLAVPRTALFLFVACFATLASAQPLSHPVTLLRPDLPDVAECRGVALAQEILDIVLNRNDDPADAFEQWRTENRKMTEASPAIECQSKLWRALNHAKGLGNFANVPAGTDSLSIKPSEPPNELLHFDRSY